MESIRVRETQQRADARRLRQMAAIRPLGWALWVVFLVAAVQQHPHPGLDGDRLVLACALVVFAGATGILLRGGARFVSARRTAVLLVLASAGLVVAVIVQHQLPVALGMALIVFTAGARLPERPGAALSLALIVAVDLAVVWAGQPFAYVVANTLLAVLLFLVARLLDRARSEQERAELLAAELADSVEARERGARLEERSAIARDLHDVLAHSLSALSIQLQAARLLAQRQRDDELIGALDRASALARTGVEDARQAVAVLRGDPVPDLPALERLVTGFRDSTGINVALTIDGERTLFAGERATTLYRACQEALTNVARYSGADHATVALTLAPGSAALTVTDHHDHAAVRTPLLADAGSGYGLEAMRERVTLLGGTLDAGPTGDGWKAQVVLP